MKIVEFLTYDFFDSKHITVFLTPKTTQTSSTSFSSFCFNLSKSTEKYIQFEKQKHTKQTQKYPFSNLKLAEKSDKDNVQKSGQDKAWNAYIDKHGSEPPNAQALLNFTKHKSRKHLLNFTTRKSRAGSIGYSNARQAYRRNKGKGKVFHALSESQQELSELFNEQKQESTRRKIRTITVTDTTEMSLEEKYEALKLRQAKYEKECKLLRQERDELNKKVISLTTTVENEKAKRNKQEKREAWDQIYDCLIADPDRIQTIMKTKVIDINEKDVSGQTLLMLSADYGLF